MSRTPSPALSIEIPVAIPLQSPKELSRPASPAQPAYGSSREVGGILRGKGDKFDLAHAKEDAMEVALGGKGLVCIIQGTLNPDTVLPMAGTGTRITVDVMPQIGQILKVVGRKMPNITRMFYFSDFLIFIHILLGDTSVANRDLVIYLWRPALFWEPCGNYTSAVDASDEIQWTLVNNVPTVYLLAVRVIF